MSATRHLQQVGPTLGEKDTAEVNAQLMKGRSLLNTGRNLAYEERLLLIQKFSDAVVDPKRQERLAQIPERKVDILNEALACFEAASSKDPDNPLIWLRMYEALSLLGRSEEAEAAMRKAGMNIDNIQQSIPREFDELG